MTQSKTMLISTLTASVFILAGCTTVQTTTNTNAVSNANSTVNTNTVTNTNVANQNTNTTVNTNVANGNTNTEVVTNTNESVSNDNTNTEQVSEVDTSNWNTFNIDQLGISIDLPYESDQVSFQEQTCGPEEACDYDGYALFGMYTLPNERTTGFLGSVSQQWSPSRDGNLYEVYDLKKNNGAYVVFRGNGNQSDNLNLLSDFEINGHMVSVFDVDNTDESVENYIYNDYLGVIKLANKGKYHAFAISFNKDYVTADEFMQIMHSILFL